MRREGRLHGYEFDRDESHRRVKACRQPTNRSKFRPKWPQEKAGRPRYKALKKMKGQRNKAHGADVAINHKMQEWALRTRPAMWLADSIDDIELDPPPQAPPLVFLLGEYPLHPKRQHQGGTCAEREIVEVEEDDFDASDWLDLGSTDGSDDDWYLC
ncbi:hypothetical protein L7F22_037864 [Adiantum nelumboides]|nr:hypothetical protein [Adiantum nelumboides]